MAQTAKTIWLDELPISTYSEGMRPVQVKTNYGKDSMRMGNLRYNRGLGAQSPCVIPFLLDGRAKRFQALVGADNLGNKDIPLSFFVVADGKILFESKEMRIGDAPVQIDLDLTGVKRLGLLITDHVGGVGNKRTYGNWANAQIEMLDGKAPGYIPNDDENIS
jgi:alpha-galactosidase